MIGGNAGALIAAFAMCEAWLRLTKLVARRRVLRVETCRKLVHIGTGPIFVLCWLLFDDSPAAGWFAALVPAAITGKFAAIGLGVLRDDDAVASMSRSGNPAELLRGPLSYGVCFALVTLAFWRQALGVHALALLCFGDGVAALTGVYAKKPMPLPWNRRKSVLGSTMFALAGGLGGALLQPAAAAWGAVPLSRGVLATLTLLATLAESLPVRDWDNYVVVGVTLAAGLALR